MKDILRRLVSIYGPAGGETAVAGELAKLILPYVDSVRSDPLGNVIATSKTEPAQVVADPGGVTGGSQQPSPSRIMLCAHMDQAGLIVTEISPDALLRFSVVGRLEASSLPGQRVRDRHGTMGVVRLDESVETKDISAAKMHIDIGARDRDTARLHTALGEVFVPIADLVDLGQCLSSPALDNRAGCAVLIEVARRLRLIAHCPATVHFVFTVQGAVAPRGARPASHDLRPDLALVIDVTRARSGGSKTGLELGLGPAIRIKGDDYVTPPRVRELLETAATSAGLAHQVEITSAAETACDAAAIEVAGVGAPTGVVALPTRGCWTTSATICLGDMEAAATLVTALLEVSLDLG